MGGATGEGIAGISPGFDCASRTLIGCANIDTAQQARATARMLRGFIVRGSSIE
jgi:hypothetical protein